jgi:DamX protein
MEGMIKPNAWKSYGFLKDPFDPNTRSDFFIPKSWEDYLDILPQFSRYCDMLVLLTGEDKIGKTALINIFFKEENVKKEVVFTSGKECDSTDYLLNMLHQKFQAPYDPEHTTPLTQQLDQQLDFLKANKHQCLLIIDDADQLPLEVRQACLQIIQQQTTVDTCMPVVLVGKPILVEQFNALLTPSTAEKCLYTIHMEPFKHDEVEEYLQWCCAQASPTSKNIFPFSREDIDTIYHTSRGMTANVDHAAQQILSLNKKSAFSFGGIFQGKVLWWTVVLAIIMILLTIYQRISEPSRNTAHEIAPPMTTLQPTTPVQTPKPAVTEPAPAAMPAPVATTASTEPMPAPTPATVAPTPTSTTAAPEVVPTQEPGPVIIAPAPAPVVAAPAKAIPKKAVPKPTPAAPTLFTSVMDKKMAAQKQHVLSVKPQFFALQLTASGNLKGIQDFINQNKLVSTAMIVQTMRDGKPWFMVLYGMFPTRQEADTIAAQMKTKKINAWVRTYASIQKEIGTVTNVKK